MDLASRLDGYLNHEIMHSNPIPVLPPPKSIKDKKDTTLFDMALKALLKERMYGNLQNFHTQNIQNKNHLRTKSNSINQKTKRILSFDQGSVNTNLSNSKNKKISFLQRKKDANNHTQISSAKKHLSQISSSMDVYMKKTNERKFRLISEKKVRFAEESLTTNLKNSENFYLDTHFISAIDLLPTQKTINLTSIKNIQTDFVLPQISDKRKMKSSKLQNSKISKALFKQNGLKITVKEQFWSFICNRKDQRMRRNKQPYLIRNESYNNHLDESINLSMGKKSVNYQNSINPNVIESKKQISKYNQNLVLKREIFFSFIGNEKFTVPSFVSAIFSFFQLSNKLIDKATKYQFELIFNELFNQTDRAWCFAIFQFLDPNSNAKIDSSDLFKVYNVIDSSKNLVEECLNQLKILSIKQNRQQINEPTTQKSIKVKRQKTVASQNGSSTHRSLEKKSARVLIENSIRQKAVNSQQNAQTQISLMKNNLEKIISLQKQIQRLNQKIMLKNSSFTSQNMSQNPQSNSSNKYKSFYQKLYLQRGLLDKKDVKITDLTSILQQNSAQKKIKNKKVLDIDHKKLNVKLSSGYVQTFIATNHNQETRINRQFLQNLKDKVKKMTEVRDFSDSKQKQNYSFGIQYAQFYEEKLFLPFKKLFFGFIQIMILSK